MTLGCILSVTGHRLLMAHVLVCLLMRLRMEAPSARMFWKARLI